MVCRSLGGLNFMSKNPGNLKILDKIITETSNGVSVEVRLLIYMLLTKSVLH